MELSLAPLHSSVACYPKPSLKWGVQWNAFVLLILGTRWYHGFQLAMTYQAFHVAVFKIGFDVTYSISGC